MLGHTRFLLLVTICVVLRLIPYVYGQYPLVNMCLKCHEPIDFIINRPNYWSFSKNRIVCVDNSFVDTQKLHKMGLVHTKHRCDKPPSAFFFRASADATVMEGYSEYEVFCALMGNNLQKQRGVADALGTRYHGRSQPIIAFFEGVFVHCANRKTRATECNVENVVLRNTAHETHTFVESRCMECKGLRLSAFL